MAGLPLVHRRLLLLLLLVHRLVLVLVGILIEGVLGLLLVLHLVGVLVPRGPGPLGVAGGSEVGVGGVAAVLAAIEQGGPHVRELQHVFTRHHLLPIQAARLGPSPRPIAGALAHAPSWCAGGCAAAGAALRRGRWLTGVPHPLPVPVGLRARWTARVRSAARSLGVPPGGHLRVAGIGAAHVRVGVLRCADGGRMMRHVGLGMGAAGAEGGSLGRARGVVVARALLEVRGGAMLLVVLLLRWQLVLMLLRLQVRLLRWQLLLLLAIPVVLRPHVLLVLLRLLRAMVRLLSLVLLAGCAMCRPMV